MEKLFTIKGVLKESYGIIKPKLWTVIGQFALIFLVYIVLVSGLKHSSFLSTIVGLIYAFVATVFSLSYAQKGSFSFEDITRALTLKRFCYFVGAAILFYAAVIGGMILLIVPGIIFAVMMYFYKYIVVERELAPIEALKESIRITKGYRSKLFGFALVAALIMILGFVCLFVGALFTMPLILIANALIYKKLVAAGTVSEKVEEVIVEVVEVETVEV